MELLASLWDVVAHLELHLAQLLAEHGRWVYALLFGIVFCETGLVVTPFLPGDSLLFVAGTVWAAADMHPGPLTLVLGTAALCGDNANYWIGRYLGPRAFRWETSRLFNRNALESTHRFFERHGGKAIIIARFVPLVRTFTPFVAGIGRMRYLRFLAFSVTGAVVWVIPIVGAGYFFGNVPVVKNNLSAVIAAIVVISLAPVALQLAVRAARARCASGRGFRACRHSHRAPPHV